MGEAKRRQGAVAFHHTSSLRTNLIWMSGVIDVEGKSAPVFHPKLGRLATSAVPRRPMRDFPPLAWFTSKIEVPGVLRRISMASVSLETGEVLDMVDLSERESAAVALHRIALAFPTRLLIRWPDYYGFATAEGRELNETAIEAGDDPQDWWVSETPVDVMAATGIWGPQRNSDKLTRSDRYLAEVRSMVRMCRESEGVYIPPSWLKPEDVATTMHAAGVPLLLEAVHDKA